MLPVGATFRAKMRPAHRFSDADMPLSIGVSSSMSEHLVDLEAIMRDRLKIIDFSTAILMLLAVGIFFTEAIWSGWGSTVDDAFITFRYSDNLANGYGLTWNRGEPPTEGYTNFLLVLILTPLIKIGIDPLLATRILSFCALMGTSCVLFLEAQRYELGNTARSILVASIILLLPETFPLALTGLETQLYTLAFILVLHFGAKLIFMKSRIICGYFGLAMTFAMFLRPEAVLAYFCLSGSILMFAPMCWRDKFFNCIYSSLIPLSLGLVYLAWKYYYFGAILPNPYYLKVSGGEMFSPLGVLSVSNFITSSYQILIILIFGFILSRNYSLERRDRENASLASVLILILVYSGFFAAADTIMDIYGRFLYPLKVVAIYGAIPPLLRFLKILEGSFSSVLMTTLFSALTILYLSHGSLFTVVREAHSIISGHKPAYLYPNSLMNKEKEIAGSLSKFPNIQETRIAFGDSGVIPYYTRSIWLDTVGLNDSFIARTRDLNELKDHLFGFRADLMIIPSWPDRWLESGHGPLGDVNDWVFDPRMSKYSYVGTVVTSFYDLEFFVRRDTVQVDIEDFLRRHVMDGFFRPFRLPFGEYVPPATEDSVWVALSARGE